MAYSQSAAAILTGKWTYRSFLNDPTQVTIDPNKVAENLLALLFAEAVFTFEIPTPTTLKGLTGPAAASICTERSRKTAAHRL